eukprot:jgi/Ulvmu1/2172/UM013_0016.1
MDRPAQRNVDDPSVTWEELALSTIEGQSNPYKVASIGEVQARRLVEVLAEDRALNRTPDARQYKSILSLVNVPGWGDKTVLNMVAANWFFQPYTDDSDEGQGSGADDQSHRKELPKFDRAEENRFPWFMHE